MSLSATTKLEAVNIMLSTIGENPVNSLTSGLVDAELAETILGSVSKAVQSEGWNFYHWKFPNPAMRGHLKPRS